MLEETIEVMNEEGLHTRPANRFVRIAKGLPCKIAIRKGDREASGTSLLKIMKLGIVQGDMVTVICDGSNGADGTSASAEEQQSMETIRAFLREGKEPV
ncbi:MAG: HPr family phosphocarrier protein [Spirochaetaceae bacterium]|nr:MAG: HPr family phosphocarrier protein [Spirochaetaceae bacterium]